MLILVTPALCAIELCCALVADRSRKRNPKLALLAFAVSLAVSFGVRAVSGGDNESRNLTALIAGVGLLALGGISTATRALRDVGIGVPLAVGPAWLWLITHTTGP